MTGNCSCHGSGDKHSRTVAATLERPRYSPGLILEDSDLTSAVEYTRSLSRLLARNLVGCGVICGLLVTVDDDCGLTVTVAPGLALDGCGDPVEVPAPIAITLEKTQLASLFKPPKKLEFWVVLCGGEKMCAPRALVCESDEYDAITQPTRIRSLARVSLAFERPECCRHDHDPRFECAPDCGCGTACACGCCLLLARVVGERDAATDEVTWEAICPGVRDGNGSPPKDNTSTSGLFIWQSGLILDPNATNTGATEPLAPVMALGGAVNLGSGPNTTLKSYLGLLPLHKKAQLKEISLLRFPNFASGTLYETTIKFDLVVMDYNGELIRTISTTTLDYTSIPLKDWTSIALSTVPGQLDVMPGELIAGQLTFGKALPAGAVFWTLYQMSGTGVLL